MKLLLDVGNTNSTLALYEGSVVKTFFIKTDKQNIQLSSLDRLLGRWKKDIEEVIFVSVVPDFTKKLKTLFLKIFPKARVCIAGEDIAIPLKNNYDDPDEVGADRLVLSYAAKMEYGAPVIVVDFGTAVTFDVVNGKGEYDGGVIFPGMRVSFQNLISSAALIKGFDLQHSGKIPVVGKATKQSLGSGLLRGYAAMCDGLIEQISEAVVGDPQVVCTGGNVSLVRPYSKCLKTLDEYLIFKGLINLAS